MNNRYIIMDTCDVTWERLSDGKIVMTNVSQMSSLEQTVSEEKIYGGIGSGTVALVSAQKEQELTVRDSTWTLDYMEMSQGVKIADGTATIKRKASLVVTDNLGTLEVTLPVGVTVTEAIFVDKDGSQDAVTVTANKIEVPELSVAIAGDTVDVFYDEVVTGEGIVFDSKKFSEVFKCTYKTIAYDPETMEIAKEVIIQFDRVKPSGNFSLNFEMGTPQTPEMNFTVLTNLNNNEFGRILLVDPA